MKHIVEKLAEAVGVLLPFLKRKDARKVKEFTDLVMTQYQFLATELDKMLKDYMGLAGIMKQLHSEMRDLRTELLAADLLKCMDTGCVHRRATTAVAPHLRVSDSKKENSDETVPENPSPLTPTDTSSTNTPIVTNKSYIVNSEASSSRPVSLLVIHCSATRDGVPYTPEQLERDHRAQGFDGPGYHFYIRRNGDIKTLRDIQKIGAHVRGHNQHSIGICYEGGLDTHGNPADTRTPWQKHSLQVLVKALLIDYPDAKVVGHRDLSPDLNGNGIIEPHEWLKQCPCFDVATELYSV